MRRSERTANKKYHFIYKTTCLVTGKYYIGMHSTNDLDDGYVGSGKYLWHSINKHGLENHECVVLEYTSSRKQLCLLEAQIVNDTRLNDPLCMNLKVGGDGGWPRNFSEEHRSNIRNALTGKTHSNKHRANVAIAKKLSTTLCWQRDEYRDLQMKVQKAVWTEDKRKQISDKYTGTSNPSAGKPWVYHPELKQCKKIHAEELETYLAEGWLKGRKMKF